mgnify:FL=1|tara:strand:+ start:348 stop:560 length:213 start_codon:yes stop_codon:yes gene_type:complete
MATFVIKVPCPRCEGHGRIVWKAHETLEVSRSCPECDGEGVQILHQWGYDTVDEVREDYPDATAIVEALN